MSAPIVEANRKLESGAAYDPRRGYLAAALDAFGIPVSSQLLLFSKTGVQQALTSPQNPRAFYFNDCVIVTHVPGAPFMEVAVHDSRGGAGFYTLPQDRAVKPVLTASGECLRCHVSSNTMEVPGFIARSVSAPGATDARIPGWAASSSITAATTPSAGGAGSSPARRTPCGAWATPSSATREIAPAATASDVPSLEEGARRPSATCRRTVTSRRWRSSTTRCTR